MNDLLHIGLDVGSTTVKVVVMNDNLEIFLIQKIQFVIVYLNLL